MELETLLDQEFSLGFNPELARAIGLSDTLMLAHLHTLIEAYGVEHDGRDWITHTYRQLQQQLPFWSEGTIKRTILRLEKEGYLVSKNYNHFRMNKTKWYSICYEKYVDLFDEDETFLLED